MGTDPGGLLLSLPTSAFRFQEFILQLPGRRGKKKKSLTKKEQSYLYLRDVFTGRLFERVKELHSSDFQKSIISSSRTNNPLISLVEKYNVCVLLLDFEILSRHFYLLLVFIYILL